MKKESTDSIKKAVIITGISKYSTIVANILFAAVLSRILSPNDYGIVAIITVFTTFFTMIANLGFGPAIVHNKTLTENDTQHLFSFTVYFGLFLALLFIVLSIPISLFYNNEVYKPIGALLSISLFFNTLNTVPNALLEKGKLFKLIGLRLIIVTVIASIVAIIAAFAGLKYYALVLQSITASILTFAWNYYNTHIPFHWKIAKESILKISNFSIYQFGFSFINYFSRNLDNLLIGKIMGNVSLAFYDKAYQLMLGPVQNLTRVITPTLLPILSEHQHDKPYIYEKYMKVVKTLSLMGVFICVLCFFSAREIIYIFFGDQWGAAVPCLQILSLSIGAQMVTSSTGAIFQSLGKFNLQFHVGLINTAITILCLVIGLTFNDLKMVCVFIAVAFNLHFFIAYFFLIRKAFCTQGYFKFLFSFAPDVLILIITGTFMYFFAPDIKNAGLSFFVKLCLCLSVYTLGLIITRQHGFVLRLFRK